MEHKFNVSFCLSETTGQRFLVLFVQKVQISFYVQPPPAFLCFTAFNKNCDLSWFIRVLVRVTSDSNLRVSPYRKTAPPKRGVDRLLPYRKNISLKRGEVSNLAILSSSLSSCFGFVELEQVVLPMFVEVSDF